MALNPLKLPDFWSDDPDLWFLHIETQFQNRNIHTDIAKYNAVVAALKPEYMKEVTDVIKALPAADKYSFLKTQLIERFTESVDRRLHKLLTELELGNQKPSQLLKHMRDLAGERASEELLRSRWLVLLPDIVSRILKAV
ncbi:uncharacterized protein LOC108624165 [Ceratina calcarata]|uniref:Uncharacterized protein LOC108624165 n=1 Tax=Ceratina calcarata TaxID=156304 RepID=A0AAJ7IWF8_9HYME|nr:uncharacterized protein LOC108624165 [Ceratina calcarata]